MRGYIDSWESRGADVDFEEIYRREKSLFGMYSSGVSCIESCCYALYALASDPQILGVPFGPAEQRRASPVWLKSAITSHPQAQRLVTVLEALERDPEWGEWRALRNRMSHRSNLPRMIKGAVGSAPPATEAVALAATSSTDVVTKTAAELEDSVVQVGTWLSELLLAGRQLI